MTSILSTIKDLECFRVWFVKVLDSVSQTMAES